MTATGVPAYDYTPPPAVVQPSHGTRSEAVVFGLFCAIFWALLWALLYRLLLPKLSRRLLDATWSTPAIDIFRSMMLGFSRFSRGPEESFTDSEDVAGMFCYTALTTVAHLLAGLLSLPAAFFGWDEAGTLGRLGFNTAAFLILGWSSFVAVDEFLRCFVKPGGLSGLTSPCPRSYWALMAFTYHPFWFTLILSANALSSGAYGYVILVCAMTLGGGVQLCSRLLLAACTSQRRRALLGVSGLLAAILGRTVLFVPAALDCVQELHEESATIGDAFLIAVLLTSCFNAFAVVDAVKAMLSCGTVHPRSAFIPSVEEGMPAAFAEPECSGARAAVGRPRANRKPSRKQKAGFSTCPQTDHDDMVFGFATSEQQGVHTAADEMDEMDEMDETPPAQVDAARQRRVQQEVEEARREVREQQQQHCQQRQQQQQPPPPQPQQPKQQARQPYRQPPMGACDGSPKTAPRVGVSQEVPRRMASSHLGGARPHLGVEIDHSDLFDRGKWGGNHGISHYAMLGLDRHATEAEVKRAFHQLSRKWHPDKNPEAKERADAIFKVIKEAYETLQDPAKRKRYDLFERVGAL